MLEAARFLFPKVHFGLVDNDCVPVTLFEAQDLVTLAESQFRWPDLTGYRADPDLANSKPGMLLFTEAHLEYNAGLVISIGSPNRPSPIEATSTAENLAEELEDYRQQLLVMAAPRSARLKPPWLTSWARATFEQGCLSALPHLEGPCKAISLPGKHLFQASRIAPNLMRPVIFHAFGEAKLDAHDQLAHLARLGWETLPCALRHAEFPRCVVPGRMEANWWVLFYRGAACTDG